MHSWRVLILPHLGQQTLYDQYDFSEPWDGPNNRQLVRKAISTYKCPAQSNPANVAETGYVAIVGPNTMWPGRESRKVAEILDCPANALHAVETMGSGIHWMEPRDLTMEEFIEDHTADGGSPGGDIHRHDSYWYYAYRWNAVSVDGNLHKLSNPFSPEVLLALLTVDGGEPFDAESGQLEPRKHWRWGRVVAALVFAVLCLLPMVRMFGRGSREKDQQTENTDPHDEAANLRS
jgi:hypothetical protein